MLQFNYNTDMVRVSWTKIGYQEKAPFQGAFSILDCFWWIWACGAYSSISVLVPDEAGANPAGSTAKIVSYEEAIFVILNK